MTQDEIIEMAKQSGMEVWNGGHRYMDDFDIYKFAKLVAQNEREKCAKVCEELSKDMTPIAEQAAKSCATFIRGQA